MPRWKLSAHTFREKPTWDYGRPSDHFHINASIWRGFTSLLLYEEVEITFTSSLLQEVALLWTLSISHHPFLEISLIIVSAFLVDDSNRGIEADKPPASSTHQYQWYHCCYRGREGNAYFFIVTRFATVIFPIFVIWELPSYTINYTIPYHTLPFNNIPSQSSIFNISLSMTPPPNYPFNNKQYQTIPYHTRTFNT